MDHGGRGKTFQAKYKALIPPFSLGYKKRVYSANRVKYPLKRVDFDPSGAPGSTGPGGRNTQNRGKSKFKRISWQEALDIVESEINRIHGTYGVYALLPQWGGHGEVKVVHNPHGYPNALLDLLVATPSRCETRTAGKAGTGEPCMYGHADGGTTATANCMLDISRYSEMLLFWGCDLRPLPGSGRSHRDPHVLLVQGTGHRLRLHLPGSQLRRGGSRDKWIPIRPGTDAALSTSDCLHLDDRRYLGQGVRGHPLLRI